MEATAAVFAVAGAGRLGLTPVSCCGHDKRMQAAQFLLSIWFRCGLQISRGCRGSLKRTRDMRRGRAEGRQHGGKCVLKQATAEKATAREGERARASGRS